MIEVQSITKRYGEKYAVKDVSFSIPKGRIVGLLGRNGAGKSTTMNIVTGYIAPSAGHVLLDGHDILEEPRTVKRRIGYLPEIPPLYLDMTVDEYLRFVCSIKEVGARNVNRHIGDICEMVEITPQRKRLIRNLSKGYRQRVGMAQALVGNPEVIILDEPTVGLDPRQIAEVREMIKALGQNHTVVLSSHILHEVADICQQVVIINRGRIVAEDSLENLTRTAKDTARLRLRTIDPEGDLIGSLRQMDGINQVEQLTEKEPGTADFLIEYAPDRDVRQPLFRMMCQQNRPILMLQGEDVDLEDVFMELTKDDGEA